MANTNSKRIRKVREFTIDRSTPLGAALTAYDAASRAKDGEGVGRG